MIRETIDELNMSILLLITMGPFRQRILKSVALIVQYTKFIFFFSFQISRKVFCLNHSRTKKMALPLNSSNDTMIVFPPRAN